MPAPTSTRTSSPRLAVSRGPLPPDLSADVADRVELREWEGAAPPTADELARLCADADGLVCRSKDVADAAFLRAAPRLRVVSRAGVGHENFDLDAMTRAGVLGCVTGDVLAETTADLTWALILACCRRVTEAAAWLRDPSRGGAKTPEFLGTDVHGKTLGIVGYGRIGAAVARRAEGFGMTVLHTSRSPRRSQQWRHLRDLLGEADIVTVHVPLTDRTTGLIGRAELQAMRPGTVLVNMARGQVVDEEALVEALTAGHLHAAATDVTAVEPTPVDHPLLRLPNAVVTPHIGSATQETRRRMLEQAVHNAVRSIAGEVPEGALNPEAVGRRTP